MASDKELRIGDTERTAAAEELGEHYAQGRLSAEEHQERLDRAMGARTASELTPLFADLPGKHYRAPRAYATADRPGVGSDRGEGVRPYPGPPFSRPPFGRPPMSRPYAGRGRGRVSRGRVGGLPFPLKLLLVLVLAALVITHLPLILIALVVWFVIARVHRGHRGWGGYQRG